MKWLQEIPQQWHLIEMEQCDSDYIGEEEAGYLTPKKGGSSGFHFDVWLRHWTGVTIRPLIALTSRLRALTGET